MTDNPSFLMRGWSRLRGHYAALGRKHKVDKSADPARYRELTDWMKMAKAQPRLAAWRAEYDKAFAEALDCNLADGMTDKDARRRANQPALQAVCDAFPDAPQTTRGVAKALLE